MALSPSWQADSCSASQEFHRILWNLKAHSLGKKYSPFFYIQNQMNQIHIEPVFKGKFEYDYQIKPRPSNWPLVFIFSYENFVLNYLPYKSVNYGSPNILRHTATSVIVGWFAGDKWFTQPPKFSVSFIIYNTIYKCGRGPYNKIWRAAGCKSMV